MSIAFTRSTVRSAFGILAALGLAFSLFAIATPALADGDDSSEACKTDINVDAGDSGQSSGEITFTADAGSVVTGVCIKSGDDAFGDDNKHSELITTDGVVGGGCYTIVGIGTDTVTVTKTDSADCKGLSHVDIVTGPGESPEESVEASVEESPEESVKESPHESPKESPEESVEASVEESVEASVEESVEASVEESVEASVEESTEASAEESTEASASEGELGGTPASSPGTVPDTALGSTSIPAWPFAIMFLMSLGGLLYLRLTTEPSRTR